MDTGIRRKYQTAALTFLEEDVVSEKGLVFNLYPTFVLHSSKAIKLNTEMLHSAITKIKGKVFSVSIIRVCREVEV
jgi:hypothetical protein